MTLHLPFFFIFLSLLKSHILWFEDVREVPHRSNFQPRPPLSEAARKNGMAYHTRIRTGRLRSRSISARTMSGDAPAVVAAGGNSTAEEVDLTEGASGTVGAAGPATAAASTPAAVAAAASSTNGDAPTTAEAEPVVVSTEASEKGHKPEAAGENGQAAEVAPASEPPSTASRKRKAGEEVPETPGAEPAEATAVPSPGKTTLLAGLRVEDLAPTVRARMEEVLKEGEDDGMRKDVRLVNFLGEVEEAQVGFGAVCTCVQGGEMRERSSVEIYSLGEISPAKCSVVPRVEIVRNRSGLG